MVSERFIGRVLRIVLWGRLAAAVGTAATALASPGLDGNERGGLIVLAVILVAYALLTDRLVGRMDNLIGRVLVNAVGDGVVLLCFFAAVERVRPVALVGAVFYLSAYGAIGGVALSVPLAIGFSGGVALTEFLTGPSHGVDGFTVVMFGVVMLLEAGVLDGIVRERRTWAKQLDLLEDAVETLAIGRDRDAAMTRIAYAMREAVNATCVMVLMHDADELKLAAVVSESEHTFHDCARLLELEGCAVRSLDGTALGEALASGQTTVVRSDKPEQAARIWPKTISEAGSSSAVYLPLKADDRVAGIVNVYLPGTRSLSREDLALVNSYSERASLQLRRAAADEQAKHAIREWEHTAHTDELTGTANRRGLDLTLRRLGAGNPGASDTFSLLMIDVDHFKFINDHHSHLVGDRVLKAVAQTIVAHVRPDDVVGRWGGDEFLVILPGVTADKGAQIAERIADTLRRTPVWRHHGQPVSATISVGVADTRTADLEQAMADADDALHVAKTSGRDTVRVRQPR